MKKVSVRNRTSVTPSRSERAKFYNYEMGIRTKGANMRDAVSVGKASHAYSAKSPKTDSGK